MGIKTNIGSVLKELQRKQDEFEDKLVQVFIQAGEQAVSIAKADHTYQDRTGNLTSSIGYGVIKSNTIVSIGGFGAGEGGSVGKSKLESLVSTYKPNQIVLVVIAGMDYAELVERRGYDVLDSARLQTPNIVNNLLHQLQ